MERLDVAVLGAGVAGLAAARELRERRLSVRVFEASARVGGRVLSRQRPGWPAPVELGAELVHGPAPEIEALARELGLELVGVRDTHWHLERDALVRTREASWEAALAALSEAPSGDLPIGDHIAAQVVAGRLTQSEAELARAFATGFFAVRLPRASSQNVAALAAEGEGLRRVRGGFGRLVSGLLEMVGAEHVTLGSAIDTVTWRRGDAHLRCGGVALAEARAVVLTPSVGVLASGDLRFAPELPASKVRAVAALEMGPVGRVVLRFTRPLDLGPGYDGGFIHLFERPVPTLWPASDDLTTFVGWSGGDQTGALLELSRVALVAEAVASLALAGGRSPAALGAWLADADAHDWSQDPHVRGAYAYVLTGRGRDADRLAEPVADTLFFAGEATHTEQAGTVHGAIATGQRAARQVASVLLR